jgi:hypothetical protein
MRRATPQLPQYAFMARCSVKAQLQLYLLYFTLLYKHIPQNVSERNFKELNGTELDPPTCRKILQPHTALEVKENGNTERSLSVIGSKLAEMGQENTEIHPSPAEQIDAALLLLLLLLLLLILLLRREMPNQLCSGI